MAWPRTPSADDQRAIAALELGPLRAGQLSRLFAGGFIVSLSYSFRSFICRLLRVKTRSVVQQRRPRAVDDVVIAPIAFFELGTTTVQSTPTDVAISTFVLARVCTFRGDDWRRCIHRASEAQCWRGAECRSAAAAAAAVAAAVVVVVVVEQQACCRRADAVKVAQCDWPRRANRVCARRRSKEAQRCCSECFGFFF